MTYQKGGGALQIVRVIVCGDACMYTHVDMDTTGTHLVVFVVSVGRGVLAELGERDGAMVKVKSGKNGPYINWKKVNAKLPVEFQDDPPAVGIDKAWELIQDMGTTKGKKSKTTARAKKTMTRGSTKLSAKSKTKGMKKKTMTTKRKSKTTAVRNKASGEAPPKRPKSAYLFFCDEKRPTIAVKMASLGDVAKELGKLWAATNDTDRQPYVDLAQNAKAEYNVLKAAWEERQISGTATSSDDGDEEDDGSPGAGTGQKGRTVKKIKKRKSKVRGTVVGASKG